MEPLDARDAFGDSLPSLAKRTRVLFALHFVLGCGTREVRGLPCFGVISLLPGRATFALRPVFVRCSLCEPVSFTGASSAASAAFHLCVLTLYYNIACALLS
eukprot:1284273-Amphidinium_carterae.1